MSPPPRAWASASYLSPRVSGPLRVQRRVLRGYGQRRARIGHLASAPGTWWSWRRAGAGEALDALDPDQVARFCTTTGIEAPEVRRRLTALARHGVPPPLALRLGLPREGYVERWAEYVSDRHLGWNLAAGGRRSRPGLLTLGDKARTASLLRDAGIPVVESVLLRAGEPAGDRVRAFLDQHGEAFLKPNTGSRGRDAHRLADARVVAHQQVEPVGDLEPWLAGLRPAEALLLQPRLVSHPDFAPVADAHDVVTLRVVTRDLGSGPRVSSSVLEVPRPLAAGERATYHLHAVTPEGLVGGAVVPDWVLRPGGPSPLDDWAGRHLPDAERAAALAVGAHRCVPRVFAVAWDVALTPAGPVFLEGNTGFGTVVPQWVAGGLLTGCDDPDHDATTADRGRHGPHPCRRHAGGRGRR